MFPAYSRETSTPFAVFPPIANVAGGHAAAARATSTRYGCWTHTLMCLLASGISGFSFSFFQEFSALGPASSSPARKSVQHTPTVVEIRAAETHSKERKYVKGYSRCMKIVAYSAFFPLSAPRTPPLLHGRSVWQLAANSPPTGCVCACRCVHGWAHTNNHTRGLRGLGVW